MTGKFGKFPNHQQFSILTPNITIAKFFQYYSYIYKEKNLEFLLLPHLSLKTIYIKMNSSELRGQEEAACMRHQAYAITTVSYYTDESSNFLKYCSTAAVTVIV